MNDSEYFKRVLGILYPEKLKTKRVVIPGCGSGGSRVGAELGRLGISLLLVDRPGELLEEHNIHRHELGYRSLGKPKTTELAAHIHNYNPSTHIDTLDCDVVKDRQTFEKHLISPKADLIVMATDNEESKHVVNELAVHHQIPMIGAGVFDGGVGGDVIRTSPGMACYACLADYLQIQHEPTRKKLNIDYNNLDLDETRSTSALNLDIAQIALIHARFALNALLGEEEMPIGLPAEVNVVTFANRVVPDVFARPLHARFYKIPRQSDCMICGERSDATDEEATVILNSLNLQ